MLGPDGQTIVYFTGSNVIGGAATAGSLGDLRPFALVAPGQLLTLSDSNPLLAGAIPDGVPPGVYTWFAFLVAPGALPNNLSDLGGGEIVALRTVNLLP